MTYVEAIKQSFLIGERISYRFCETVLCMNHPAKNIRKAIQELSEKGLVIREGNGINPNTMKAYKDWRISNL